MLFWSKQLLAVGMGLVLSLSRFGGIAGLACAGGVVVLVSRMLKQRLQLADDVLSEGEMLTEGLAPAFQTFLVSYG